MTSVITIRDERGGSGDATITIRLLRDAVKLQGIPYQGANFFTSYYPVFRGRGIMLSYSKGDTIYGLFASINSFFGGKNVMYIGCEESGEHLEAAAFSPSVISLEAYCPDSAESSSLPLWGPTLARSLSDSKQVGKDPSKFRIKLEGSIPESRDRDLIIHYIDNLFPPAPTAESVEGLTKFGSVMQSATLRLCLGGFYVIATPMGYSGIDLILSTVIATVSPVERPLVYVGMILYGTSIPLWIFRIEPMNGASIESQRTMALARLKRYPPMLQVAVDRLMPTETQIGAGVDQSFEEVLSSRVTPTDSISSLFRVLLTYPREVLNRLANFQPKYSKTIDAARAISDPKIQTRMIVELLYDLALASQRKKM